MTQYRGLDKPKGRGFFLFWKAMFVAAMLALVAFFWVASSSVEYIWRWNRVPQYFWVNEAADVRAEAEGDVTIIDRQGNEQRVVVRDASGEEHPHMLPGEGTVLVSAGDFAYRGDVLGRYQLNKPGILLEGLWITLEVSVLAIIGGIVIGVVTGLCRISINPMLRWGSIAYIEIIRGSPLLVQIFLWYFVVGTLINALLEHVGLGGISPLWYGVMALALFTGAYVAEIVRAGIQSVHRGQMEAARSLGMSYAQAMRKVILPQAFRRIMPPLAGQFISLIKDSSLLGVIAIRELTKATREVVTTSLQPFELWIVCAVLYLVLTFTLSLFVQYLERRAIR
ncbi:ABC transporter permease subunit [Nitratidesulfovibrio sp. D1]|uniref:amino acid ABC transporter permease n=1 Tax=Nitratidesulfovibrio sp. D1 TaxID=3440151 RepID=UPI003EBAFC01